MPEPSFAAQLAEDLSQDDLRHVLVVFGDDVTRLTGVLRDPASRGGSTAMHDEVSEGQLLQISAPANHFPLAHEATQHLLLARGIGVTTILCMDDRLATSGAACEIHHFSRPAAPTPLPQPITAARCSPPGLAAALGGRSTPGPGCPWRADRLDRDRVTRTGEALEAKPDDPSPLIVFGCGTPIPGHDIRTVDAAGLELPDRPEGLLQFRGPSAPQTGRATV